MTSRARAPRARVEPFICIGKINVSIIERVTFFMRRSVMRSAALCLARLMNVAAVKNPRLRFGLVIRFRVCYHRWKLFSPREDL